jgi:hypothetical protein
MTGEKPDLPKVRLVAAAPRKPATLKEQLETEIRNAGQKRQSHPFSNAGDWLHLGEDEAAVFNINPARFPRMLMTFACYETFKLIADDPTWDEDLIEQARQQHPEWCDKDVYSVGEFQAFAKEFAGLSFREAHAMWYKQEFWNIRVGISSFTDEGNKG